MGLCAIMGIIRLTNNSAEIWSDYSVVKFRLVRSYQYETVWTAFLKPKIINNLDRKRKKSVQSFFCSILTRSGGRVILRFFKPKNFFSIFFFRFFKRILKYHRKFFMHFQPVWLGMLETSCRCSCFIFWCHN